MTISLYILRYDLWLHQHAATRLMPYISPYGFMRNASWLIASVFSSNAGRPQLLQLFLRCFGMFKKGWILASCLYVRHIDSPILVPCEPVSAVNRHLYWHNLYMTTIRQITFVHLALYCTNMLKTFNDYVSNRIFNEYLIREFRLPFLKGDRATWRLLGEIIQNQGG